MYKICNQTLFLGKNIFILKKYSSSNVFLKNHLRQSNICEGTIVHVINQTNGAGQRGHLWESLPNKNITCSLLLKPVFLPLNSQFLLNIAICLSVCQSIAHFVSKKVKIKWPNDIYIENQKIAGILIENVISNKKIKNTIVGIGINTNQNKFDCPNAVSISNIITAEIENELVVQKLYASLEYYYHLLKQKKHSFLWQEYYKNLIGYKTKRWFTPTNNNQTPFIGEIIEISERGLLVLKVDEKVRKYDFQEIRMVMSI